MRGSQNSDFATTAARGFEHAPHSMPAGPTHPLVSAIDAAALQLNLAFRDGCRSVTETTLRSYVHVNFVTPFAHATE